MTPSRQGAIYFSLQAFAVATWWVMLWRLPSTRVWFLPPGGMDRGFGAFAVPDLLLMAAGSAATAWLLWRGSRSARTLALLVSGGVTYAALYTVTWTIVAGAPILSLVSMVAASALSLYHALRAV